MSGVTTVPTAARRSHPTSSGGIQQRFPNARVGNGFGLTETSSIATFLPHEYAADHADSVGFAAPVVDLDLDTPDPQTGWASCSSAGPNVVARVLEQAGATQQTFSTAGCTAATSRGSARTGSSASSTG